jgi:hypothetical protein
MNSLETSRLRAMGGVNLNEVPNNENVPEFNQHWDFANMNRM